MKRTVLLIVEALFLLSFLVYCGADDSIIGTWEGESNGLKATFVFNEDGTGSVSIDNAEVDARWTVAEDKYLTVEIVQSETAYKLFDAVEFSVGDGALTILDNGEQAVFTRKK